MTATEEIKFNAETCEVPESLCFLECGLLQLADEPAESADGDKKGPRRFRVVAHTGRIMRMPWIGNFALDLDGLQVPKGPIPLLLDHDTGKRLGCVEKNSVEDAGKGRKHLISEGTFLKNAHATEVLEDADGGFPWQASVYVPPLRVEHVEDGAETTVNGQKFRGPGVIFREYELRETTITALGRDADTSAAALSMSRLSARLSVTKAKEPKTMTAKTETVATAAELSVDSLRSENREVYDAIYKLGVDAERNRSVEILEECHSEDLPSALKHIREGSDLTAVLKEMLKNRDARKGKKLAELQDESEEACAPGAPEDEGSKLSNLPLKERAKAEFEADDKLRDEFGSVGKYEAYLAKKGAIDAVTGAV